MTEEQKKKWIALAVALGACYVGYRFGPNAMIKGAAASVGAVIVARQLPIVGPALA